MHRALELVKRRTRLQHNGLDVLAERAPAREPILARDDELRIRERERGFVGELGAHSGDGPSVTVAEVAVKLLRELLLLVEIWTRGQRPAKCRRHHGLLRYGQRPHIG